MNSTNQKTPYTLNAKQLQLLALLYKFRYITIPLLTHYTGLKAETILLRSLRILVSRGLVDKEYDLSYKMRHMPALYYLSAAGIKLLQGDPRFHPGVLHALRKNSSLSDEFKQHCVTTLEAVVALRSSYGDRFDVFTRQELGSFDELPEHKPDLYLRRTDGGSEYFLTLAHDVQPFIMRKRLAEYVDHSEEVGWSGERYPTLLHVFKHQAHEQAFTVYARRLLESAGIDEGELRIGTTTIDALHMKPAIAPVWRYVSAQATRVALA